MKNKIIKKGDLDYAKEKEREETISSRTEKEKS